VLELGDPALAADHAVIGHTLGIAAVLAVAARVAPGALPRRVHAVGVEAEVLDRFGTRLSPPVRDALPEAVATVLACSGSRPAWPTERPRRVDSRTGRSRRATWSADPGVGQRAA